jgi:hypothetical protein
MQPPRTVDREGNTCPVCGEQVAANAAQLQAGFGFENMATGEYVHGATLGALHARCYMRLAPADRLALLEDLSAESEGAG